VLVADDDPQAVELIANEHPATARIPILSGRPLVA
jgi:hypothetical protein